MTLSEAIVSRHSVRKYTSKPLPWDVVEKLNAKIDEINREGNLHAQLVTDEPKAFTGIMAYGKFSGVRNYVVLAGKKSADLDERAGYYGQALVLYAQTLGLNTCWVGLSYRKVSGTFNLEDDEKILVYIAIGYGENQGSAHKTKTVAQLGGVTPESPEWYVRGVEAARLAPTAINQQKFRFACLGTDSEGNGVVKVSKGFSLVGYTAIDLGIAEYNFTVGAAPQKVLFHKD